MVTGWTNQILVHQVMHTEGTGGNDIQILGGKKKKKNPSGEEFKNELNHK